MSLEKILRELYNIDFIRKIILAIFNFFENFFELFPTYVPLWVRFITVAIIFVATVWAIGYLFFILGISSAGRYNKYSKKCSKGMLRQKQNAAIIDLNQTFIFREKIKSVLRFAIITALILCWLVLSAKIFVKYPQIYSNNLYLISALLFLIAIPIIIIDCFIRLQVTWLPSVMNKINEKMYSVVDKNTLSGRVSRLLIIKLNYKSHKIRIVKSFPGRSRNDK